jgi:DeoR family transcriptional regulator, suf operon transcriptional repressor
MIPTVLDQRFHESTRGRIVALLRRAELTVEEMAESLELTDNAVRAHLVTLERDGLVRQEGVRRGGPGKPAYTYRIAPGAEQIFSRAYVPILAELLRVLAERLPPAELEDAMRQVGRRLAAHQQIPTGPLRTRVEVACALLSELGGSTEVVPDGDGDGAGGDAFTIRGRGCPLTTAVHAHPGVCRAVETLIAEVTGAEVTEQCERGERANCCFEVVRRASA